MMRAVWASTADCAVVQMQDVLGLGNEARMNTPPPWGQLAVAGPARLCRAGAGRPPPPADGAL